MTGKYTYPLTMSDIYMCVCVCVCVRAARACVRFSTFNTNMDALTNVLTLLLVVMLVQ